VAHTISVAILPTDSVCQNFIKSNTVPSQDDRLNGWEERFTRY